MYVIMYVYIYTITWFDEYSPEIRDKNPQFHPDQTNLAPHLAIAAGADACVEADETTTP